MRIERITAQAVNRGIHEAHSRSPSSGSDAAVSSRNLFAEREWDPEFARASAGSVPRYATFFLVHF